MTCTHSKAPVVALGGVTRTMVTRSNKQSGEDIVENPNVVDQTSLITPCEVTVVGDEVLVCGPVCVIPHTSDR